MMNSKHFSKINETLYTAELPNGLRINVVTKPGFELGYAVFATNYGGAHRRFFLNGQWHDTPAGVAHFLEHKMFDMPDGDNALSVLSANGAQPNAFTSSGMTAYYFSSTSGFEKNLRMLLKFVSTPYFTDETVSKEQGIIGQEIGMVEDSPGYVIYNRLMRMLYEHNPVRDQVAGSVESIAEITAETLYNCHKAGNGEIGALVVRLKLAADRVVGIEYHMRVVRQRTLDDGAYKLGVGVAAYRVTEQIRANGVIGMDIGVYLQRAALVDLEHGELLFDMTQKVCIPQQRACDTGVDVRACLVIEHIVAVFRQHIEYHVAAGGLAVCAGDGDDGLGLIDAAEKVRAQLDGDLAGEIACIHAEHPLQQHRRLADP